MKKNIVAIIISLSLGLPAYGAIEIYEFNSTEDEHRYRVLIEELRCPKCQNQNLAGSDAPIAQDLKRQTYEMIQDGRSNTEIRNFMFERYGDFISYKPPVRPSTWILWFVPPVLLVLLVLGWIYKVAKSRGRVATTMTSSALTSNEQQQLEQLLARHRTSINTANSPKDPKDKEGL